MHDHVPAIPIKCAFCFLLGGTDIIVLKALTSPRSVLFGQARASILNQIAKKAVNRRAYNINATYSCSQHCTRL